MARPKNPSEWVTWRSRDNLGDLHLPGVYFIGVFPTSPPRFDIQDASIRYIGLTTAALKWRLLKFHYSAFNAKDRHSGGRTYCAQYMKGKPGRVSRGLRVCVIPVYGEEPARSALIKYLERRYIHEFVKYHNRLPACNRT